MIYWMKIIKTTTVRWGIRAIDKLMISIIELKVCNAVACSIHISLRLCYTFTSAKYLQIRLCKVF
jgi:hypothetical protein